MPQPSFPSPDSRYGSHSAVSVRTAQEGLPPQRSNGATADAPHDDRCRPRNRRAPQRTAHIGKPPALRNSRKRPGRKNETAAVRQAPPDRHAMKAPTRTSLPGNRRSGNSIWAAIIADLHGVILFSSSVCLYLGAIIPGRPFGTATGRGARRVFSFLRRRYFFRFESLT